MAKAARLREALGLPKDLDEVWSEASLAMATDDVAAAPAACRAALAGLPAEDALNRSSMLSAYARVLLGMGIDEEAWSSIEPLERSGVVEHRAMHRSLRARLLVRRGDIDAAVASIDEAIALVAPTGLAIVKADVALDRAHVMLAAGLAQEARASAKDALRRYRTKEHAVGARQALALLEALGDTNQISSQLDQPAT
jgi:tetratricopeptide (TPR) repeat protein